MQVYQAIYRFFLSLYLKKKLDSVQTDTMKSMLSDILDKFAMLTEDSQLPGFRENIAVMLPQLPCSYDSFKAFITDLSEKQDTIKFWYNFTRYDCFAYISLYIGIRYQNWQLRTGSLKTMAAVFEALDRPIYQRLVPQHLKDLAKLPDCLLRHLMKGGFSVRLTPSQSHDVALDECHEMKINKDAKLAVIRPNEFKMVHTSHYLQFRADSINNFRREIFQRNIKNSKIFTYTKQQGENRGS